MDGITRLPGKHRTQLRKFAFVFKTIGCKISEISGEEIKKFAEKAVNKIQSKLQTRG